jgi:hypothetical protein
MIPSTSLAVLGWARTFTCVEVVPWMGVVVGVGGGGSGVWDGGGVNVGTRVDVTINAVGVSATFTSTCAPHPAMKSARTIKLIFFTDEL